MMTKRTQKSFLLPAAFLLNFFFLQFTLPVYGQLATLEEATTKTIGQQNVLVLLVNFQDDKRQPFTIEQVQNIILKGVNDYYQEASYGKTYFSVTVKGYYTLPLPNTACSVRETVAQEAIKPNFDSLHQGF